MTAEMKNPSAIETLVGDIAKGWDSTDRLDNRVESFAILKQRTVKFLDWAVDTSLPQTDLTFRKPFRLLNACGQYLIFRNYLVQQRSRLIGACTCKQHLLCAFCASRRGVRFSMAYKSKVETIKAENPNLDLLFLTFTVQNGDDLFERFHHIQGSMQKLMKKRNDQARGHRGITTEMHKCVGGVFSYEIKRGANQNRWHPHIHMLALIPKGLMIDAQKLKDEWLEITGDSHVINLEYATNDRAFLEIFAYALKFSEMENSDRWEAAKLLKGERLVSSFGDLRGVVVPEIETDDLLDSDEPFVDVFFQWFGDRYQKVYQTPDQTMQKRNLEIAITRSADIRRQHRMNMEQEAA